jgi:hypothetical protein
MRWPGGFFMRGRGTWELAALNLRYLAERKNIHEPV